MAIDTLAVSWTVIPSSNSPGIVDVHLTATLDGSTVYDQHMNDMAGAPNVVQNSILQVQAWVATAITARLTGSTGTITMTVGP